MLLGTSVVFLIAGLVILVYSSAFAAGSWGPEMKIAVCFSLSLVFVGACNAVSWYGTEWRLAQISGAVPELQVQSAQT